MQETVGQVLSVQGRTVGQNKDKTIYDVAFSDGRKYQTFDAPLATKAQSLIGQAAVTLRFEVKVNGQYTNYNLSDVAPAGQLAPMAQPVEPGTPVAAAIPMAVEPPRLSDHERNTLIVRQNVLGTAFGFVGHFFQGAGPEALNEAEEIAHRIASELFARVTGGSPLDSTANGQDVGPIVPTATTPAEVAAEVPGVQVGVTETAPAAAGPRW